MEKTKISSYIGFSIRSGKVLFGIDSVEKYNKRIQLVLVSNTISENSLQNVKTVCEKKNVEYMLLDFSIEDITKRNNCKVLGILNPELSKAIKNS